MKTINSDEAVSSNPKNKSDSASSIIGTYEFMSPEQREGEDATKQSDIYSLGMIIYKLLTGKKAVGRFKLPSYFGNNKIWDTIIEKCLENEPDDRFDSVNEILIILDSTEEYKAENGFNEADKEYDSTLAQNGCIKSEENNSCLKKTPNNITSKEELQHEQSDEHYDINNNESLVNKQKSSEREFVETLDTGLSFYDKDNGIVLLKAEDLGREYYQEYGGELYKKALFKVDALNNIIDRMSDCSLKEIVLRIIEIPVNHKNYHDSLNKNKIEKYINLISKFKKQKLWQGWLSFFCVASLLSGLYGTVICIYFIYTLFTINQQQLSNITISNWLVLILCFIFTVYTLTIYLFLSFNIKYVRKLVLSFSIFSIIYVYCYIFVVYNTTLGIIGTIILLIYSIYPSAICFLYFLYSKRVLAKFSDFTDIELIFTYFNNEKSLYQKSLNIFISFIALSLFYSIYNLLPNINKVSSFNNTSGLILLTIAIIVSVVSFLFFKSSKKYKFKGNDDQPDNIPINTATALEDKTIAQEECIKSEENNSCLKKATNNIKSKEDIINNRIDIKKLIFLFIIFSVLISVVLLFYVNNSFHEKNNVRFPFEDETKANEYYNKKNYREAIKWYKKAVQTGNRNTRVYSYLGLCYGELENYTEAIKWFKKDANNGDTEAMYVVGGMYYHGQGVSKNYSEAVRWFRKAARSGSESAKSDLKQLGESY